ncbi:pilus assembly protein TadG-related protein [Streptomyces drozdowiczii]|uniref:Pilus assembly protein TadG-related protein n=1 Tax=Streptomyces drozdowiczii TaxID=202862 RepID=A0ABY6PQY7_9ACTN|nr:pilus assembly protein TadG-related protein [Streptomyces drozdowiczii]MCX0245742.1 pilus assembly protein TadG-related protein [Streptomyces drozdowiczii]UZK54654.1 pilus assembly protein TadG-related protein [Streptomyces drozdowiczii]
MKRESGQATPLYIAAVTGLLFVALIFLAFGEADIQRNGAQSAADAAALAAAKESRGLLAPDLEAHLTDPDYLDSVFNAAFVGVTGDACGKAADFAARNRASEVRCRPLADGRWGYEVSLRSDKGMSTNVIPGSAGKKATAVAVAVVEPRCTFIPDPGSDPDEDPSPDPSPTPDPDAPDTPDKPIGKVRCDGGLEWGIDPEGTEPMPDMADFFSVHLAEN